MVSSALGLGALCGLVLSLPGALAGFSSSANNNIEIYWGQNSVNRVGGQQRLSAYCSNTPLNVIPLAFLNVIKNPTSVNFANAGDNCTVFAGTQLLSCPQIEADIKTCQAAGKTITLSIGGATYTEGGFTSSSEASTWADKLWAMFGPVQSGSSALRPFGSAVVDGFDLDLEAASQNMGPFAVQLRNRMNSATAAGGKKYFLSAAPQCPFPDAAMGAMLDAVVFDYVSVQFYNNYCGATSFVPGAATQNNFNFATWDTWARSKSPPVKVLLGLPGSTSAAGSGYVSGSQLSALIAYCKQFSTFGGVMFWDMSQVYSNSGFLDSVVSYLGGSNPPPPPPPPPPPTSTTAPPPPTTLVTVTRTSSTPTPTPTGTLVQQWGQCGGIGYTGSTQCAPPYSCNYLSQWWAQCQ